MRGKAVKERKRVEAAERQAVYDQLTNEQKVMMLDSRRGLSKKERARLVNDKAQS